jgi:predicted metal-dependent hydrolase
MKVELRAICETWEIVHEKSDQRTSVKKIAPYKLLIKSPRAKKRTSLENWLKKKARRHLSKWLQAIGEDLNITYKNLSIRGQKRRWGSCSENKEINLNYKLLFLPHNLVEHILTHELCHTKELNHSKQFWQLVASHDANYRVHRKLLHQANQYLPKWLT